MLLLGVALVSGALGGETYGRDPRLGVLLGLATSVAYACFLLVLRSGAGDLRRLAGPLLWMSLSASASAAAARASLLGELVLPGARSLAWLLAHGADARRSAAGCSSRAPLPRLPAALTSVLLLAQPVGALALAALAARRERRPPCSTPGPPAILAGVVLTTATARPRAAAVPALRRRRRTGW